MNDVPRNLLSGGCGETKQDDTLGAFAVGEDELPEVLVFRQDDAPLTDRQPDDLGIFGAGGDLNDADDIVPGGPQGADDREVAALVGQEAHAR
jgi:hypothetical protein